MRWLSLGRLRTCGVIDRWLYLQELPERLGGLGSASCGFPDKTSMVWIKPPGHLPTLTFLPSPSINM